VGGLVSGVELYDTLVRRVNKQLTDKEKVDELVSTGYPPLRSTPVVTAAK
jgi:hypothetical protein